MKKLFFIAIFLFTFVLTPSTTLAQSITGTQSPVSSDNHTASEEQEGKEIWDKLQAKQLECKDLTNDNYAVLGEYFMGQSIGDTQRHAAMNQMMSRMMGEEGEEQMHITMGKRLSGCDTSAQVPQSGWGFMPMMWMMGGGGNSMMGYGGWGNMMGWGFGILGWLFMIIFGVLIILGVVALIRYLGSSGKSGDKEKTPLEILKERYAKGEINKKEFEEEKKELA
ncbi:hypothetical protein COS81_02985 [candidate division WWE3 bacterium CG06_land_8_20_14_3_00_42_16]|uniref:SHOCT domain-containing protein n=3 Tax=Katanobacteria TaxID=422282 RepID=A0A2M7AMS8_UNCKA|nr:MAG: hypothetical protein COS81_02985 [candidate division WWE3 bacterium CG06_land_8_20_14_3_00_42_16]PJA37281.1 MAG: hypothetical protein CO181_04145 [candidate division WWE3 bacterium CG_4_9_14_3_um_filter_43_9]PJC69120.1 MAG: hypothetical protein CO015_01630 [candidate division WWE3 bacterium CG_4_8_14_3_um_filter_42_11]